MIIEYANNKVERICNDEQSALKIMQPSTCLRLKVLMTRLHGIDRIDLFRTQSHLRKYRYHELQGAKKGIISLSIDHQYRMELRLKLEIKDGEDIITILEVSNHYGD